MVAQLGSHKVRSEPRPLALASSCPVQQAPRAANHGEQTQARDGVLCGKLSRETALSPSLPPFFIPHRVIYRIRY